MLWETQHRDRGRPERARSWKSRAGIRNAVAQAAALGRGNGCLEMKALATQLSWREEHSRQRESQGKKVVSWKRVWRVCGTARRP